MIHVDAIIIGTGQAGPLWRRASRRPGKTVAVIERHLFGGTCVNTGRMPAETLVASAYAAHLACRGVVFDMARVSASSDAEEVAALRCADEHHLATEWHTPMTIRIPVGTIPFNLKVRQSNDQDPTVGKATTAVKNCAS